MAKKEKEPPKEGVLAEAAKVTGTVAGKIAPKTGVAPPPPPETQPASARATQEHKKAKPGKLTPKNKSRLPRKQKKALRKSGGNQPISA